MSETSNTQNDWPLEGIKELHENDVPLGRGGFVNSFIGHQRYLEMVQDRKLEYAKCRKVEKAKIAWSIVHDLRALDPPARFVIKDSDSGLWNDVGDKKFREKVSQALRENQPYIKAVLDDQSEDKQENAQPVMRSSEILLGLFEADDTDEASSTEDLRKTFASERNENVLPEDAYVGVYDEDPFLQKSSGGSARNLSEVLVSQGPSFMIPESSSTRNSISLTDLMNDILQTSKTTSVQDTMERFSLDLNSFMKSEQACKNWTTQYGANEDTTETLYNDPEGQKLCVGAPELYGPSRPDIIKRATSNQNESTETKRGYNGGPIKRCTLSRDKSAVSRKLKQENPPDISDINADYDTMMALTTALEQSFPITEH